MKHTYVFLLIFAVLLSSCSSKFGVMKRRYNKGYYVSVSSDKKNGSQANGQSNTTRTVKNESAVTEFVKSKNRPETLSFAGVKPHVARAIPETKQKESVMFTRDITANAARRSPQAAKALKQLTEIRPQIKLQTAGNGGESDTNTILLVILAIFIPPLAVYLKNQTIDKWFWITLILCLVGFVGFYSSIAWAAYLAAAIIAILYVLGKLG